MASPIKQNPSISHSLNGLQGKRRMDVLERIVDDRVRQRLGLNLYQAPEAIRECQQLELDRCVEQRICTPEDAAFLRAHLVQKQFLAVFGDPNTWSEEVREEVAYLKDLLRNHVRKVLEISPLTESEVIQQELKECVRVEVFSEEQANRLYLTLSQEGAFHSNWPLQR